MFLSPNRFFNARPKLTMTRLNAREFIVYDYLNTYCKMYKGNLIALSINETGRTWMIWLLIMIMSVLLEKGLIRG